MEVIEAGESKPIFSGIESFEFNGSRLKVTGWCINAPDRIHIIEARVGPAAVIGNTVTTIRKDLAGRFSHTGIPERNFRGFELESDLSPEARTLTEGKEMVRFRLSAMWLWRPRGEINVFYVPGMFDVPWPEAELSERVMGTGDPRQLSTDSLRRLQAMLEPVKTYRPLESFGKVLDWGCRAGYLEAFIAHFMPDAHVTGIDTDAEAIESARQSGRPGEYIAVPPVPPTELPADSFDLVLGYSMLGRLTMEEQWPWLQELHRVMKSGAYALLTLHGELLSQFIKDDDVREHVERGGFSSDMLSRYPEGSADAIPRRATYQAKAFSIREYSSLFDVMRYRTGALNDEDLIVLRKQ
jgi:SAM-dependent methyltransferase